MDTTISQEKFVEIFKNNLKKDARTVSIDTLLSDRYLNRITYDPYYQRNYVWQKDKQSFFIESVILGTEIPPLVFYKSGMKVEVIDGRQRFETLKRFKEDDFALNILGLLELQALAKKTFSKLNPDIQRVFLNTKIRIFEFEVVGMPNVDASIEDKIKKEIFRRYNTGITPLNQTEVDNAKYDSDELSDYLKCILKSDNIQFDRINKYFFKNSVKVKNELIVDMVTFLRKVLVLNQLPIARYADTSEKTLILDLIYDNYIANIENIDGKEFENISSALFSQINESINILEVENIYIYECLLWGISILKNENINFDIQKHASEIISHYSRNKGKYSTENDHYYANIISRFTDTTELLNRITNFNFKQYIRSNEFKDKLSQLRQTEKDAEITIEKLSDLRINKPAPASKPIEQVIRDLESNFYMVRPTYQRQEKITIKKASSIIESILLGIKLPPIFVYVREDGIREVVDGQQRLLSILGFLGKQYVNEEGVKTFAKINNFKLRDLRILKDLNGEKFSTIRGQYEDTILDFDIDEIEISYELNKSFEPTDLFIRLNSKPYPIKPNTFEMWNSIVDKDVIQAIKEVTNEHIKWFYIKSPEFTEDGKRTDRMQNEELVTILSYLCFNTLSNENSDVNKVLGFYPRLEKFTCRLKNKTGLSEILEGFEFKPSDKEFFLRSIKKTNEIINLISELLDNKPTKESFNSILNIKNIQRFSRSNQELYIIWIMFSELSLVAAQKHKKEIFNDIKTMLSLLKNINEEVVDANYVDNFLTKLKTVTTKYKSFSISV